LCFSIIREVVGNVKKHANTSNAWIVIERRERDLVVAIRDDGDGFDVSSIKETYDRRGSLGLLNIKERSEALGARYAIESAPGRGTLVYLIVPLSGEETVAQQDAGALVEVDALPPGARRRKPQTGPLSLNGDGGSPTPNSTRRKGTGPLSLLGQEAPSEDDT
jgi:hypothetical protein